MRILLILRLLYKYQAYHPDIIKGTLLINYVEDIVQKWRYWLYAYMCIV